MIKRNLIIFFLFVCLLIAPAFGVIVTAEAGSRINGKIAFCSYRDGNYEIYVMNSDGSGQTRLTNNNYDDYLPDWSPVSSKIVFASNRDGNWEVYVMNADGSGQMRLTTSSADEWYPDWSPDGKKIIFTSNRDGNPEIYIMNVDGSGQTRLTSNSVDDYYSRWQSLSKQTATLALQSSTTSTTVDADFFLNATLSVSKSGPVTLYWSIDGSGFDFSQTGTMTNGRYDRVFAAGNPGIWSFKVVWAGDDTYNGATSDAVLVSVNKIASSVSCQTSSSTITNGNEITVTGSISPAVSGKTVSLTYTKPDGTTKVTRTVTTDSDGSFSDSYEPDTIGAWSVTASWEGDTTHDGASSSLRSFNVNPEPSFFETPFGIAVIGGAILVVIIIALIVLKRRKKSA